MPTASPGHGQLQATIPTTAHVTPSGNDTVVARVPGAVDVRVLDSVGGKDWVSWAVPTLWVERTSEYRGLPGKARGCADATDNTPWRSKRAMRAHQPRQPGFVSGNGKPDSSDRSDFQQPTPAARGQSGSSGPARL